MKAEMIANAYPLSPLQEGENIPCPPLNHYGPTENTVVTTWTTVLPRLNNAAPPIGRPIFNTQAS